MKFRNRYFLLSLALILFAAFKLSAQDYYVSELSGNDTNSGSEDAPFATINKGIAAVSAGGTVYVMNGEYKNQRYGTASAHPSNGELSVNMSNPPAVTINKSGTEGNYITIRNYPNHSPKIIFDGKGGILISGPQSYVIIEGFEVQGPAANITYDMAITDREWKIKCHVEGLNYNHNYFSGFGIWGGFSQDFLHHHIIVRNNIVHDTTGSGIRFNDSDHITIENNTVYNTTWWTSNASSAIVFAEAIARSDQDNGDDIKMIMRGNTVYNNWNRILFYKTNEPPNSDNDNPTYGTAAFIQIWDGQGLYVTRSDDSYNGTFLFENNLCVNNGKNGINFDHSIAASGLMRNNTIYYNGVHEIIQDLSVAEGNTAHRGQKVGGLKANKVKNITVLNNIVMTRDNNFSAVELLNIYGSIKVATNNIFVNGTVDLPGSQVSANQINVDPLFVSAPTLNDDATSIAGWAGYLDGTDFSLQQNSPAINRGLQSNTPTIDILGNPRPSDVISSSSFEAAADGWMKFGDITVSQSTETAKTGSKSLKTSGRSANYHSPKINLNGLLTVGETYTFYVWVKLAEGSGSVQLVVKSTVNATTETAKDEITYINLASETATANGWVQLKDDYTHTQNDQSFLYIKGPSVSNGQGVDYFIDDFSLVTQGTGEVDFTDVGNVVDIGAYEYQAGLSISDNPMQAKTVYAFPNPTKDILTLINLTAQESVGVYDLLGRKQSIEQERNAERLKLNVSNLKRGLYFINVSNSNGDTKAIRFIKK
jgi:parallel beta-helix repeat protein